MSRQTSAKKLKPNDNNDLESKAKQPAGKMFQNHPNRLGQSSNPPVKAKFLSRISGGGHRFGRKESFSPPPLFKEPQGENIEAMMIVNLRQKMQEFNEELNGEMAVNSRLHQRCKDYADKLTSINAQFETYRFKQESRQEAMVERQDALKESLREERELVY
jgi:hypothetical protein